MKDFPMMKCGHTANSLLTRPDGSKVPACVICAGIHPNYNQVVEEKPDLTGRIARCYCGKEKPSSFGLPFFQYCGPESRSATETCVCGYAKIAHSKPRYPGANWCDNFTPRGDRPDEFYCGCHGWD
jgi:hypothetical protein